MPARAARKTTAIVDQAFVIRLEVTVLTFFAEIAKVVLTAPAFAQHPGAALPVQMATFEAVIRQLLQA